jgi:hypothetical protein
VLEVYTITPPPLFGASFVGEFTLGSYLLVAKSRLKFQLEIIRRVSALYLVMLYLVHCDPLINYSSSNTL